MKPSLLLALALTFFPHFSEAGIRGVVNGGGGKGLLCGDRLRLLDLYEGELAGFPAPITSGNFDTDLRHYMIKMSKQISPNIKASDLDDPAYGDYLFNWAKTEFKKRTVDIAPGETLEFTNDATLPPLPPGCRFVQIAVNVFDENGGDLPIKVYRDRALWNLLAPVDQVALVVHEYTLWMARLMNMSDSMPNSDDTRRLVGRMFSELETYNMYAPIWDKPSMECFFGYQENGRYKMYQWQAVEEVHNGVSGIGVYFGYLKDKYLISRTSAFLPNLRADDLLQRKDFTSRVTIESPLFGRSWSMDLQGESETMKLKITPSGDEPEPMFAEGSCRVTERVR
jgi:hypothetical protein